MISPVVMTQLTPGLADLVAKGSLDLHCGQGLEGHWATDDTDGHG